MRSSEHQALPALGRAGAEGEGEGVTSVLQIASGLFALAAAGLWLVASLAKTPDRLPSGPLEGTLFDVFDEIHVSLAKQSRWNAYAAACAAIAALLQAIQILFLPA
jgi:hypothetical protein